MGLLHLEALGRVLAPPASVRWAATLLCHHWLCHFPLPLIPCIQSWSVSVMSSINLETPLDEIDLTGTVSNSCRKCLGSEEE